MITESETRDRRGIVCLFCGKPALLSPSDERRLSIQPAEVPQKSAVLLMRCPHCFKEAPYGRQNVNVYAA